ncbi:MAG: ribonuclease H [Bifidobacterium sp.]|uniref:ribonuclease H n=2 Tax=Bifidobacterium TaxID=1678 RepID=A0AB39UNG5_9BIFI
MTTSIHNETFLTVSTDGSALGNPKAEPTRGKPNRLSTGEVSAPNGARKAYSDSPMTVSTDGSALGNPNGPMGWGWVDHRGTGCDAGGASNGTNQIGELCAVLQALRAHPSDVPLIIESDSKYAIQCSTTWLKGWKRNGWKNSKRQPVKNAEIIRAIDREIASRTGSVKFVWVKGHAGNEFNEKVDDLAHGYALAVGKGVKTGSLPIEGWQSLLASPYASGVSIPDDVRERLAGGVSDRHAKDQVNPPRSHTKSMQHNQSPRETPMSTEAGTSSQDAFDFAVPERRPDNSELSVSGSIRISPPPSSASTHASLDRRVIGTISVDLTVDADGYARINDAPLHVTHVEIIGNA